MQSALSAQVVINISLDTTNARINYTIATIEGESSGVNQLADKLRKDILTKLPKCLTETGAKQ
ncbi:MULTISPECIES: hypothetical protein [Vibrio]|jgi:hypothetical protein|uniref:hypothetical protein n=1 Tax=Vibrio TaxID=662 RepID=UPI000D355BEE|nr:MULTISPECIES: hypothetical protein [Vibrio]PTP90115.1 hypothetical protein CWO03_05130 [Vibrio splendidus]